VLFVVFEDFQMLLYIHINVEQGVCVSHTFLESETI
jgi:hypothetical protein